MVPAAGPGAGEKPMLLRDAARARLWIRPLRRRAALLVAIAAGLVATAGSGAARTLGSCTLDVPDNWERAGNVAVLKEYRGGPGAVLDMVRGSDWRLRPSDRSILLYARNMANGSQFRSLTRHRPACSALVSARSADWVERAQLIAKSLRQRTGTD